MPAMTLGEISRRLGLELINGGAERIIDGLAGLAEAGPSSLTFLSNPKYAAELPKTRAAAAIVPKDAAVSGAAAACALLPADNPDLAFAMATDLIHPPRPRPAPGIHPSAVIDPAARIGANVFAGPGVVIEAEAEIGDGCVLHPGVYVGAGTKVGRECLFYPNVVLYHDITIGDRCILHAGAVIGADGFGYAWTGKGYYKISQVGTVVLENDVEIGANSCVDRARFGETRIGAGSKLDNLIQIGHNVVIGKCSVFAALTGVAGSARIGNGVQMGGHSAVAGHIAIGDGLSFAGRSGISKSIPGVESGAAKERLTWIGVPAKPMHEQLEDWRNIKALGKTRRLLRELEERVRTLESKGGEGGA